MKASPLLLFPVSEYQRRLNKILAAMEREGFDAVILTSDENTFYLSGFRSIVWDSKVSTPGTVIVTKDGSVALATSQGGAPTAGATSCVEDIRTYPSIRLPLPARRALWPHIRQRWLSDIRQGDNFAA